MKKTISVTFDAGKDGDSCEECPMRLVDYSGTPSCPFCESDDMEEKRRFRDESIRTSMCRKYEVNGCESWEDELHG